MVVVSFDVVSPVVSYALYSHLRGLKRFSVSFRQMKKKVLVSRNAGDEKNLHLGGRKFISLINLIEIFK